ncbi:MAG: WYL domain-containing protein, partial [Hydrogenophaga sp.]|nr:WYL domain-containing protein [Hydrogenophaga sp.]
LGLGAAAASARLKMVASLPAEWREQAERVGARLHIDPLDWYRAQETPVHLREVAEAVWNSRRIALRYESWRGQAERELEPLGLVLKAGTWYMAARSQGQTEVRTYRLAAVRALRTLTTRFRRPAGFDLAHYWQASAARFEAELQRLQARVRVSPRAMGWLVNARTPFARVDDDAAAPGAGREGWVCVLLPIESIEHGARRLLSYGAEVEVLAPAALRQHLQGELAATRALYANGRSGAVAI